MGNCVLMIVRAWGGWGGFVDMRRKFGQIHKEYSPQARKFYCHFTAVTVRLLPLVGLDCVADVRAQNTQATSEVLVNSECSQNADRHDECISLDGGLTLTLFVSFSPRDDHHGEPQEPEYGRLSLRPVLTILTSCSSPQPPSPSSPTSLSLYLSSCLLPPCRLTPTPC